MFFGIITKHHLVQIEPVAIKAKFCVIDSFSAGRKKSEAPAATTPHFITGALHIKHVSPFIPSTKELSRAMTQELHTRSAPS